MASNPISRSWTVEEYLAYEEKMQTRYEYIDGEIYAMSGGTANHSLIKVNCIFALRGKTLESTCHVFDSDMKVKVSDSRYVYPDFSVVCGKAHFTDDKEIQLTNPILVGEVISDTSASYDKSLKADFYRSIPSLKYYLIIDQNTVHVQMYSLQDNGWLLQEFKSKMDVIPLDAIGITLPVNDIYRDIELNEAI